MLGPLFAVLIMQFFVKWELSWPPIFRNIGLVIVGVAIGQAFDITLFSGMGMLLVYMVVINIILMICCTGIAFVAHRFTGLSFKTALTASVPGGLSQLVLFAEEEEDIDLAVVTFFHVIRVIAVVMFIPFLISGHILSGGEVACLDRKVQKAYCIHKSGIFRFCLQSIGKQETLHPLYIEQGRMQDT